MAHIHRLPDGRMTGIDRVVTPDGDNLHDHGIPGGGRTSANTGGPGHIHTYRGDDTGGPIPVVS